MGQSSVRNTLLCDCYQGNSVLQAAAIMLLAVKQTESLCESDIFNTILIRMRCM